MGDSTIAVFLFFFSFFFESFPLAIPIVLHATIAPLSCRNTVKEYSDSRSGESGTGRKERRSRKSLPEVVETPRRFTLFARQQQQNTARKFSKVYLLAKEGGRGGGGRAVSASLPIKTRGKTTRTKPGRRPDEINTGLGEGESAVEISSRFVTTVWAGGEISQQGGKLPRMQRDGTAHFHRGTVYERFISGELADSAGCPRGCFAKPRRKIRRGVSSFAAPAY